MLAAQKQGVCFNDLGILLEIVYCGALLYNTRKDDHISDGIDGAICFNAVMIKDENI